MGWDDSMHATPEGEADAGAEPVEGPLHATVPRGEVE